jgi:hypothetical protein
VDFFDKKQDVIDLQLTQYGRHLMSKGKFKPEYYSFSDDNILYNSELVSSAEEQNESSKRIKETPTMRPQISISSLEEEFANNYNKILSGEAKPGDPDLQPTAEKNYLFPFQLGSSNINSDFAPAWKIDFLKGHLSGSKHQIELTKKSPGSDIKKIPQLDSDMIINYAPVEAGPDVDPSADDFFEIGNFSVTTDPDDLYILLKIQEVNGQFQKENFDIEVYEIQEVTASGAPTEILKPLYFVHQDPLSVNLLDVADPEEDNTYASYYFDIETDDQIDQDIICKYDFESKSSGVFSDSATKVCEDILNEEGKKIFDIYDDESDSPDEVC